MSAAAILIQTIKPLFMHAPIIHVHFEVTSNLFLRICLLSQFCLTFRQNFIQQIRSILRNIRGILKKCFCKICKSVIVYFVIHFTFQWCVRFCCAPPPPVMLEGSLPVTINLSMIQLFQRHRKRCRSEAYSISNTMDFEFYLVNINVFYRYASISYLKN